MTAYRSDVDNLEAELETLRRALADARERKTALGAVVAEEERLEQAVSELAARLLARRAHRKLEVVQVASPCSASWGDMIGDDRSRFCGSCAKYVYNLSAMSAPEAAQLMEEREGKEVCVRLHRRTDGKVLTSDCPTGRKRKRMRRIVAGVAFTGVLVTAAYGAFGRSVCGRTMGEMRLAPMGDGFKMGKAAAVAPPPTAMGTVAPEAPPAPPATPKHVPTSPVVGR